MDYKIGITKTEKPQNGIMEIKTRIQTLQNPKVKHSKNVKLTLWALFTYNGTVLYFVYIRFVFFVLFKTTLITCSAVEHN